MQIIIITAADANYFELVRGTILSVREKSEGANVAIGFFDLGCTSQQLQWLETQVNIIKKPDWDFDFPGRNEAPEHLKGLLVRPCLRKYFPNFDIYLWIDADAWVQDWRAINLLVEGASRRGLAIVPEVHRASLQQYGQLPQFWSWVYQQYEANFGEKIAKKFYSYPILNAGVFALRKDALHWEAWADKLHQGLQKSGCVMTDQFALNLAVYSGELFNLTEMLPAWCNWIFNGLPVWDKQRACFVEPYLPHGAIGILHLAGRQQFDRVQLTATDGDLLEISVRYQSKKQQKMTEKPPVISTNNVLHRADYVSPGFQIIRPDCYFPNMILTDPNTSDWPYLRREIPHNWYADKRYPFIGFLNRDEAHILYNTALQFSGKKALEIGCWLGWSACHLALAGVELDVVDPLLERDDIRQSVIDSIQGALNASGVQTTVELIPGYSPQRVEEFATQFNRQWSLIFIDGEHGGDGPLNDAIACEKLAEKDAIILFHDLAAPDVAKGLDYLKQKGWHTLIYQTMQIMGAAWRGNVEPAKHQPDPNISWELPAHLQGYDVSGNSQISTEIIQNQPSFYTRSFYELIGQGTRSSAQEIIALLLELMQPVKPQSVVDVGCGTGSWLATCQKLGIADCLGIDGDYVDRTLLEIPLNQFKSYDLKQPLQVERKFDLAISLEVAEHLPSTCAENLVNSLTKLAPIILFSAAIPFQGGVEHVNEQWPQYWAYYFQQNGFAVIDCLRKKIWNNEKVEPWYAQNILVFVKEEHLSRYPRLVKEYQNTDLNQLAIVHPKIYFDSLQVARNSSENSHSNHPQSVKQVAASPQLASQPLISVIIPCYNQSHFLPQAVTSVINQTYKNWEIIIINDGSLDTTSTVAKQLIAANPQYQIRLIEQANQGISIARNTGISAGNGEYIMPLDADDILAPNALICLLEICLKSQVPCIAFGSYQLFGGNENHTIPSYDLYSPKNIKQSNMICTSSLYHKSVWNLVNGYKAEMKEGYEDWEFWVNCHKHSIPFWGTREIVLNYRHVHGSRNQKAQPYHDKLVAQIVSYNPELYDIESVNSANKLLDSRVN
ncbi:glycosyltransferase [Tychonema sp. LEGE 07199]|uniref:glycosyltransferase n=1 Tax=unclassified Tychonema TaxID=2642144 RepID=UPI0018802712|nr:MULTISPECIES: glycosyltransferase [unclassified Tychonema]MBE9119553.1 glycosyltransferase [Tychonema sp. LEGE 07199]MBE9131757.1 glycosyltransferase [Tychonema sp. LEGE 07196]